MLSGDLPTVREKKIPVELALSDEEDWPRTGYMDFAENRLDRATATVRVRAILDNPDLLMTPGMFAKVRVRASAPYQALILPDSAIGTDQNQRFVFVLQEDNTVVYRKVELGPRFGSERAISSGLESGEWVAIDNLQFLRSGTPVDPLREKPEQAADSENPEENEPPIEKAQAKNVTTSREAK